MSSYIQDVKLEEVDSNINPSQEALLNIIQELEDSQITLSDESKKGCKYGNWMEISWGQITGQCCIL